MQRSNPNHFFKQCTEIGNYQPNEVFSAAIVIDPNIFFFSLQSNTPNNHSFHIHPILHLWLDAIRSNPESQQVRFYLLAQHDNSVGITVNTNCGQLFTLITPDHLLNMISQDSAEYVSTLFGAPYKTATLCASSSNGLMCFTDGNIPLQEEILVITSDAELAQFFHRKQVAVAEMDSLHKPLLTKPLDLCHETHKLEIYSDFDRTLFDIDTHFSVTNTPHMVLRNGQSELNASSIDKRIMLIQKHTVSFLENYRQHPTYLITQRPYQQKEIVDNANQSLTTTFHVCHDVESIITHINSMHSLSIQVSKESFLDWQTQVKETHRYDKKIQKIFDRLHARPAEERPTHVLLLDDDLIEILKCTIADQHYAGIGIQLHYALILHPNHFSSHSMSFIKSSNLDLFNQIDALLSLELAKLTDAYDKVKNPMKQKTNESANDSIEDGFVMLKPDNTEAPYKMCVIS